MKQKCKLEKPFPADKLLASSLPPVAKPAFYLEERPLWFFSCYIIRLETIAFLFYGKNTGAEALRTIVWSLRGPVSQPSATQQAQSYPAD